jgi:hypothetical protein
MASWVPDLARNESMYRVLPCKRRTPPPTPLPRADGRILVVQNAGGRRSPLTIPLALWIA